MITTWRSVLLLCAISWLSPDTIDGLSDTNLTLPVGNGTGSSHGQNSDQNNKDTYGSKLPQEYMIWPPTHLPATDSKTLKDFIDGIAPSLDDIYASSTQEGETCFILANLSDNAAVQARKHPLVSVPFLPKKTQAIIVF